MQYLIVAYSCLVWIGSRYSTGSHGFSVANSLFSIVNHVLKCRTRVIKGRRVSLVRSINREKLAWGPTRAASLNSSPGILNLAAICACLGLLPAGPSLFIRPRTPVSPRRTLRGFYSPGSRLSKKYYRTS